MEGAMKPRLLLAVVGLPPVLACADDGAAPAKFTITTKRKDDGVEVEADKDKAVCVGKGPSGISQAAIEREGGKWPDAVVLRLHRKGLEAFRASSGKVTV
jgi:hypothetical protein